MQYRKFTVRNYKAISSPLEIDLRKQSLTPIIGINECGKTTILKAIFAFDYFNDRANSTIRHLEDTQNLYSAGSSLAAEVSAEISITWDEFSRIVKSIKEENNEDEDDDERKALVEAACSKYLKPKLKREFPETLTVTRELSTKRYKFENESFKNSSIDYIVAKKIVARLPYILYFDDFRDSIEDRIEIKKTQASPWLGIIEKLFKDTNHDFSVHTLAETESRQRKSILSQVKNNLNKTLTKEWQNFRLDDNDALKISIEFESQADDDGTDRHFIKLEIIETNSQGEERYFYIGDRSKGFYWFFNFVMKLEFNPKSSLRLRDNIKAIYLLDEPGSYLHAFAQSRLCRKLQKISQSNSVIYCTHSHYLLDPEIIPLNNINIASKDHDGSIKLLTIEEFDGDITEKRSAFQPILDALKIKPVIFDLNCKKILIAEGIYDYYAFEMLKGNRDLTVLPATGASSSSFFISFMIAFNIKYRAIWDNDIEGIEQRNKAIEHFGPKESENFYLLPLIGRKQKCILQDLFHGEDLRAIKGKLGLPKNSSFKKVILALFFSENRDSIIQGISERTLNQFNNVFRTIGE